ncbi:hypothetical protein ACFY2K_26335 [Kitasatospora sp. NPDC001309]|uniref:hypothetical protein n=1 Tax=Kitasatospora sp. NPDC001309 TaxID=3364013 RepID=UPI00367DA337
MTLEELRIACVDRDGTIQTAAGFGIELDPEDVIIVGGAPTIDGMPAAEWLEAMAMD